MVCLDTCFVADLFRKNPAAEKKLLELTAAKENISITVISVAELYYGAYKSKRSEEEIAKVEEALKMFSVLEMNILAAEKFGEIMNALESEGEKVADRDVLIAAVAISNDEQFIVTRNEKDFGKIASLGIVCY